MNLAVDLTFDRNFEDFNFSAIFDPGLEPGKGPSTTWLYGLAYLARMKHRTGASEFSDAMYWTLKEGSFDAFKWKHGPRPASYEDWFYQKLLQFSQILLYERLLVDDERPPTTKEPWKEGDFLTGRGPLVDTDLLEQAFWPQDIEDFSWYQFVDNVSRARNPFERFQELLRKRIAARQASSGAKVQMARPSKLRRVRRSRNDERNSIIIACRRRGLETFDICVVLDKKGYSTTKQMLQNGLDKWADAYDDRDFKNNVEQVFSKAVARFPDTEIEL